MTPAAVQANTMIVFVNGARTTVPAGCTVADLAQRLGLLPERGVAVEVAGAIVPRGQWSQRLLRDGERVEAVRMVGGGA